jgi:hypothetical protein
MEVRSIEMMPFEDITDKTHHRLRASGINPGGMRSWGCIVGVRSYVIVFDPEEEEPYNASYSYVLTPSVKTYLEGRWKTFAEAERACQRSLP